MAENDKKHTQIYKWLGNFNLFLIINHIGDGSKLIVVRISMHHFITLGKNKEETCYCDGKKKI